jgi:hypothetical protein
MALVHGGAPIRIFSKAVFKYICGADPACIIVEPDEISDMGVRSLLTQVL